TPTRHAASSKASGIITANCTAANTAVLRSEIRRSGFMKSWRKFSSPTNPLDERVRKSYSTTASQSPRTIGKYEKTAYHSSVGARITRPHQNCGRWKVRRTSAENPEIPERAAAD